MFEKWKGGDRPDVFDMNLEFRNIQAGEAEQAYRLICDVTAWLLSKDIRQWTAPLPRDVFDSRQVKGENYGLFNDGIPVVFMSLLFEPALHWKEEVGVEPRWWLCTLATAVGSRGKGLGEQAVRLACGHLRDRGAKELWLDCVRGNGFLPDYYARLGFVIVSEKTIDFPKCGRTGMVLMKRIL
jgi:GNAT superfamily N-acetyltransferase